MHFRIVSKDLIKNLYIPNFISKAEDKGVTVNRSKIMTEIISVVTATRMKFRGSKANLELEIREAFTLLREIQFNFENFGEGSEKLYEVYTELYPELVIIIGNALIQLNRGFKINRFESRNFESPYFYVSPHHALSKIIRLLEFQMDIEEKEVRNILNKVEEEFYKVEIKDLESLVSVERFIFLLRMHGIPAMDIYMQEELKDLVSGYLLNKSLNF